jgi:hypothetical protein
MRKVILTILTAFLVGGCLGPAKYEGKTAEEWQAEYKRMETKHEAVKGDFDGLQVCLSQIEPGFLKSSGSTVGEITACLEEYGG